MKQLLINILGWGNMLLFSIVAIPQIIKTIKTKVVDGISIWMYYLIVIANIDAWFYAFLINQPPLLAKYTFGLVTAFIYIYLYHKYNKKDVECCSLGDKCYPPHGSLDH